jgi:hypothetical protein
LASQLSKLGQPTIKTWPANYPNLATQPLKLGHPTIQTWPPNYYQNLTSQLSKLGQLTIQTWPANYYQNLASQLLSKLGQPTIKKLKLGQPTIKTLPVNSLSRGVGQPTNSRLSHQVDVRLAHPTHNLASQNYLNST